MHSTQRPSPVMQSLEARVCLSAGTFAGGYNLDINGIDGLVTDRAGDVYATGVIQGTVDLNPSSRKTYSLTAVSPSGSDRFVARYTPSGGLYWVRRFKDTALAIAVDFTSGDLLVGGQFTGTVDFGKDAVQAVDPSSPLTFTSKALQYTGFFARLDHQTGVTRYAVPLGGKGASDDLVSGITADAAGNVYVSGTLGNTFNDDSGLHQRSQAFVMKFTPGARYVWERAFGNDSDDNDATFNQVVADAAGNVYIAGRNQGWTDYNLKRSATAIVKDDQRIVLKLTSAGNFGWVGALAGGLGNNSVTLAVDPSGDLLVGGAFATNDFNFSANRTYTLTAGGSGDGFVAKYSPTGGLYWVQQIGNEGHTLADVSADMAGEKVITLATDAQGYVYVGGRATGDHAWFRADQTGPDFPATGVFPETNPAEGFVAKYSARGKFLDAWEIGRVGANAYVQVVALDRAGNLFATGFADGGVDLDPSDLDYILSSGGDTFVVKLA